MKSYNRNFQRYVLLNLINAFGSISRTQLADMSGFRLATVGEITKELLDEGLAVETGFASSGAGRRRAMVDLNRRSICAVGVSIARSRATAVLARLDGSIVQEEVCEGGPDCSHEALSGMIVECVARLLDAAADMHISGIGVGDPLYDPASYPKGSPLSANYGHFNDWVHLMLIPGLEARFGLPVRALSAVTLPVLVERQYGAARGVDDFICVELSNGIGASVYCNGMAVSGAHGVAGELGHTVVDLGSRQLCYCGKTGCAELGASFPELARSIAKAVERGAITCLNRDAVTPGALRRALEEGDRLCRFYVDRAAEQAGAAIANAVNLLNPALVVLYGYMLELGDYYLERLREAIRANTLEISRDYEIRTSPELESKIPLGAAAEMFTQFLHSDEYRWVYSMLGEGASK